MRYTTTVLATGGRTTGIAVPDDVLAALDGGRRPPVVATVAGYTYRSTLGTMEGRAMLPLSAENRAAAGVEAGQEVEVELVLDTAPRELELPDDLVAALDAVPGAREAFDRLAPSRRKAHVLSVTDAKTPETRHRRVEKVVAAVTS